ncbi:putative NAD(P)-binding domain-containing protein [Seiridium cardinale]|uniref:NAD(P)-binding domain-containing protein n=1 Tax=Seiridium cardinale TaxID=138064 RepID=A0ABR2X5R8_9PEZI
MTSKEQKVLIVGPGFIGWNVLDLLVKEKYLVTGFVRRKEHGDQIKASGASDVVIGDLSDKDLITEQTAKHDIVIHTATADDLPSVEAVLDGLQRRADKGLSTIYIHTSGTSVLDDGVHGAKKSDKIYYDNVPSDIDALSDSAPHRKIDLAIIRKQKVLGEKAKLAIMIPPLIYGFNDSHKRLTIQIPTLTRFALKHGYAGHVGDGLAVESNIHVKDLGRAYRILLHHMEHTPPAQLLENPYYFCEATGDDEPSWKEVAELIGESLHKAGQIKDPKPRTIDAKLYGDLFGEYTGAVAGLNSRSRAVRLRELGWKPVEKSWQTSYVQDELPEILKEEGHTDFKGYTGKAAS